MKNELSSTLRYAVFMRLRLLAVESDLDSMETHRFGDEQFSLKDVTSASAVQEFLRYYRCLLVQELEKVGEVAADLSILAQSAGLPADIFGELEHVPEDCLPLLDIKSYAKCGSTDED